MILLKQHGPHPQPLAVKGLQCRVSAHGGAGGSWRTLGTEPSLGLCHQWELVVTQGVIQCSKQSSAPRAELPD